MQAATSSGVPARRAGIRSAIAVEQPLGHVGGDEAGGDGVDRDVTARDLGGDRLGHADQPGLGGGVVALAGVGAAGRRPLATLTIRPKRARSIGFSARRVSRKAADRLVSITRRPVVVGELRRETVGADAGVVDEHEHADRARPRQPRRSRRQRSASATSACDRPSAAAGGGDLLDVACAASALER